MDLAFAQRLSASNDPKAITALQQQSRDPAVAKAVAGQFGTLLMQRVMQNGDGEAIGMAGGVGGNIVNAMFASTVSQAAMSGDRLGLADLLFHSMEAKQNPTAPATQGTNAALPASGANAARPVQVASTEATTAAAPTPSGFALSPYWQGNGMRPLGNGAVHGAGGPPAAPPLGFTLPVRNAALTAPPTAASPAANTAATTPPGNAAAAPPQAIAPDAVAFSREMTPLLQKAAQQLGVSPKTLMAHAALETGWGHSVVGNNIFGIKAGASWSGARVMAATHEIENGQSVPQVAAFRAYPSLDAAVQDYVSLISGSERYRGAIGMGDDARRYGEALIAGGYATDGDYPNKLQTVAASATMAAAFAGPKPVLPPINLLARQ